MFFSESPTVHAPFHTIHPLFPWLYSCTSDFSIPFQLHLRYFNVIYPLQMFEPYQTSVFKCFNAISFNILEFSNFMIPDFLHS